MLKNIKFLPFDFLINKNILLEIDGLQHFNWKSPQETQKCDFYKMKQALDKEYKIIRIFQEF